jgi:hypothetical protein
MECRQSLQDYLISLSIGTAEWQDRTTLDEMLDAADHSVYEEKNA